MDTVASAVKELRISASSSGDNTVLAALGAGLKIRVLGGHLIGAGSVDAIWKSGSTALTGARSLSAKTEALVDQFTTNANEALILNLSGAVAVVGVIQYVEVEVI